jgi:hypothetical protein
VNEVEGAKGTFYKDYNFFSSKMQNYMDLISSKGQTLDQLEADQQARENRRNSMNSEGDVSPAKVRARSIMRNVITKQVKEMIHALNVFKSDRNKKVNKIKQISMLADIITDGFKNSLNTPKYTNFYNFIELYVRGY